MKSKKENVVKKVPVIHNTEGDCRILSRIKSMDCSIGTPIQAISVLNNTLMPVPPRASLKHIFKIMDVYCLLEVKCRIASIAEEAMIEDKNIDAIMRSATIGEAYSVYYKMREELCELFDQFTTKDVVYDDAYAYAGILDILIGEIRHVKEGTPIEMTAEDIIEAQKNKFISDKEAEYLMERIKK